MADQGSGLGVFPMGLVAFAAIVYSMVPGSGGAPAAVKTDAKEAAASPAGAPELPASEDPLKPLCDFLNVSAGKQDLGPDGVCASGNAGSPRPHIRFLVALVPDPVDSHLAYLFDRAVDAIQRGVQDNGYVLDRFSLPWKKEGGAQWHLASGLPDSLLTLSPKPAPRVIHRRVPGLLLFRGTGNDEKPTRSPAVEEQQDLVAVLLVGETPTAGIQRLALTNSLRAISRCNQRFPGLLCDVGPTKIVGPFFSGSAESLHKALLAWQADEPDASFEILSGSATVDKNIQVLRSKTDDFAATVIPDKVLTGQLFDFLRRRMGVKPQWQVALFVEAGTGYGSASDRRSQAAPESEAATSDSDGTTVRFVIHFPLHVSQLRGAYEKNQALKTGGLLDRGPRRVLELPLETASGDPPDTVPAQDSQMASNVAELALASGIEAIRRERIRMVGIVASDPRDVLFLARKIVESGANVSLFTSGADILYAHPDYQRFLRGMMIATPYPLFLTNQRWTRAEHRRIAFPGFAEEGIYNAIAILLDESSPPVIEYHAPDGLGVNRPPVWITAVGRGGFWPVAFTPDYDDHGYVRVAQGTFKPWEPVGHRGKGPPGFLLSFLVVDLFVAFSVVLYIQGRRVFRGSHFRRADQLFTLWRSDIPWSNPDAQTTNRIYAMTFFLTAFFALSTFMSWFLRSADYEPDRWIAWVSSGLAGILLVCVGAILAQELRHFWATQRQDGFDVRRLVRAIRLLAPAGLLVALGGWLTCYLVTVWRMDPAEVLTFYGRALDLTSTLSPIVPFVMTTLVLFLWTASGLQRSFLLAIQGNLASPFPSCRSLSGIEQLYQDVVDVFARPFARRALIAIPLGILVPFNQAACQEWTAVDGHAWSSLFRWLLLACFFVVVYSFSLFVLIWIRMRRVLRLLAHHPLADAFRRLPESCTATPWKLWRTVPNLTTLAASVGQLRIVANLGRGHLVAPLSNRLDVLADEAEALLAGTFVEETTSVSGAVESQLEVRGILQRAVTDLTPALESVWAKWPNPGKPLGTLTTPGRDARDQETASWLRLTTPTGFSVCERAAEELIALRISAFCRATFQHMKNLLSFVFLGFVLMLAAISSYPFEPKNSIMALSWCVVLAAVVLITWCFVGMELDPILSNIAKTEPGKFTLNREFLSSLAIYVLIPLLTLLATQFPGVGDVVFSIFNPAMKSLSH